jgi:exodeoxyribonuclease-3
MYEKRVTDMKGFTIATFNVNSVRSRMHIIEPWLHDSRVGILCLQETKTKNEEFPETAFGELGYKVAYSGEKGYNGVAVASLESPDETGFGLGDGEEPDGTPRMAHCRFGDLNVINLYIPQGKAIDHPDYPMKLRFFERLVEYLHKNLSPKEKLVIVGDLNVAPTDMDVTHPERKRNHVCFHEDVKKAFRTLLEWGLEDVFRKHRPEKGEFSFWDYRVKNSVERNIGWRIDHVLATPPLAKASRDAWVDKNPRTWEKPSDHAPVVAAFDLQ